MKRGARHIALAAGLLAAAALSGCEPDERKQAADDSKAAVAKAREAASEAADKTGEAASVAAARTREAAGVAKETLGRAVDTVGERVESSDAAERARAAAVKVGDKTEAAAAAAGQAINDATGKAADSLRDDRAAFTENARERLRQLDAEIADLEARARPRADQATATAVAKLRQFRNDASAALDRAKAATADTWNSMKPALETAFSRAESARAEAEAALR
jgi:hypothetical protein